MNHYFILDNNLPLKKPCKFVHGLQLGLFLWLDVPSYSFLQGTPMPTSPAEFPLYLPSNRRWICKLVLVNMLVHLQIHQGCCTFPIQGGCFATTRTPHLSILGWASMFFRICTQHAKQQEGLIIEVKTKEYYIT